MNRYLFKVGTQTTSFLLRSNNQVFRSFSTEKKSILETIDQQVKGNPLVLYMKGTPSAPQCGFSNTVVRILEAEGVGKYESHNVLENDELRDGIKKYGEWPTIPQVYIKGELVGGADIMLNLYKSGELSKMLQDAGIIKN
ncbi:hypothetical protein DICPUDRAFT_74422 [Dictyostelium purpureum]|uniref:Glutaredoxin domain-containing protein n=1 Tax=Dictyostelium purpureum TaxID=5786 RepID=F0Z7P6_DICPU|nr:uncharacterized protein DICPUDRAFT_74422 [Dictyostelium purpureum]EGC40101.1 hypothetical protein DICPUDRAFT_74422 [Dictyostelium purpureum]|eukprot:XP_003283450.1 hypothetical protein DICPUDRAFT_74422 [Dictyostelium purpureum]